MIRIRFYSNEEWYLVFPIFIGFRESVAGGNRSKNREEVQPGVALGKMKEEGEYFPFN
jgi:hypothetical protein